MSQPVKLYVYDLSQGMAKQLSRQLTGRQIDGIWHTSVVVYGKEIFYGQGISTTAPGRSHHGAPMQVIDMGETALDEETFNEYIQEMSSHYTADKYHLLEFNCNSFTDDVVGFLTGGSIPSFIKDLPTDFLSTPFGAALRPTIDAMYRRPGTGAMPTAQVPTPAAASNPQLAASILQSVASQAAGGVPGGTAATQTLTAPVHIITNVASFNNFVKTHRAAVAFFTSTTCGPCKVIEPVFERLAEEKGVRNDRNGAAFAKIDIDVGMAQALAAQWNIRATPTFIFFLDGQKLDEIKGANQSELRTQIDLLLFQAYPPHPHTSLSVPAVQALSTNAIIFSQVPPLETVVEKLSLSLDASSASPQTLTEVKNVLKAKVLPYLRARHPANSTPASKGVVLAPSILLETWTKATTMIIDLLPVDSLFPLVDLWRLGLLDPAVGTWIAAQASNLPVSAILSKAIKAQDSPDSKPVRNYTMMTLRLLCNAFSSPALAQRFVYNVERRSEVTTVLIASLLHTDATVRTAAASLAFDAAAVLQTARVERVRMGKGIRLEDEDDLADWEVEVVTALVEALEREKENEEVVHRLAAALAFFLRLSPHYESQLKPLLEVLQSKDVLRGKLTKSDGWNTDGGIKNKDVRKLVDEVSSKLCA